MPKRPTLADIARAAQVSMMTASRAINHRPGVSEPVRQRIIKIATEMGYRPNSIARGLATQKTEAIGLVVPDITNPFFAQITRGVEDAAFENQYNLFLLNANEDPLREAAALDSLWQRDIDGVILCSSRLSGEILEKQIRRFPAVVIINREVSLPDSPLITINVDDQTGAQTAVQYLLGIGRQKIAYISGPLHSVSNQRRLQGYRLAIEQAGIPYDPHLVEHAIPNSEGGRAATAKLLERCPDLDAILAFNDLAAIGAIQVSQEVGKKVPQEIAVIGADDIPLASIVRPMLTTLHVDLVEIGKQAFKSLLDLMLDEVAERQFQIEPELLVRESA